MYILTNHWDRAVRILDSNCRFIYFSLLFYLVFFALYILKLCYQVHKCLGLLILDEVNPCYYEMTVFASGYIICSKICLWILLLQLSISFSISFSLKFFLNKIIAYTFYIRNIPLNKFGLFHSPYNRCQIRKQVLQS